MDSTLEKFVEKIKKNEKFRNEFKKCKDLKESYNKFMKGKCDYDEYEHFFNSLMQKATPISDQDLSWVAGGVGLKQILAPIAIVTMLTGFGAISAHAANPNENSIQTSSATTIASSTNTASSAGEANSTNTASSAGDANSTDSASSAGEANSTDSASSASKANSTNTASSAGDANSTDSASSAGEASSTDSASSAGDANSTDSASSDSKANSTDSANSAGKANSTNTASSTGDANSTNTASSDASFQQLGDCVRQPSGSETIVVGSFEIVDNPDLMTKCVVDDDMLSKIKNSDNVINILCGIKYIKLKGDAKLAFIDGCPNQVEYIDAKDSSRYIVEYAGELIKLYNKLPGGKRGKLENIIKPYKNSDGYIFYFNTENKTIDITLEADNVKLPEYISNLGNVNIKVGKDVKSLTLNKNDRLDLSGATSLENVDTTNSNIYEKDKDNVALYETTEDGQKKLVKVLLKKKDIGMLTVEYSADDDQFIVYSQSESPQDIKLPESLTRTNKLIKVGKGIKSLTFDSQTNFDFSQAKDLEKVENKSKSGSYVTENNIIYEIVSKDGKESKTPVKLLKSKSNSRYGLDFSIEGNNDPNNPSKFISISKNETDLSNLENVKIPDQLIDLNRQYLNNAPFKIQPGIQSLVLKGDEKLDLSMADNLIYVDTTKSSVYYLDEDGVGLYEQSTDGTPDKLVKVLRKSGVIGKIHFTFGDFWGGRPGSCRLKSETEKVSLENVEIPSSLSKVCDNYYIESGIESMVLKANEKILNFDTASLKDVNVEKSNIYIKDQDGIALYERSTTGGSDVFVKQLKTSINDGKILIAPNNLSSGWFNLWGSDKNNLLENVQIPDYVRKMSSNFCIGPRIKSMVLGENDVVDITNANDLEFIDTSKSKIYETRKLNGFLYLYNKLSGTYVGFCRKVKNVGQVKCRQEPNKRVWLEGTDSKSPVKNLDLNINNLYDADLLNNFPRWPNSRFVIGPGIESIILHGDDEVDLSGASDLKYVDVADSKKYTLDANKIAVFKKTTDGSGKTVENMVKVLKTRGKISTVNGDVNFEINPLMNSIPLMKINLLMKINPLDHSVTLSNDDKNNPLENFKIPDELKKIGNANTMYNIGPGIKSIILSGNEWVNLNMASDLEHIDASSSDNYITDSNGVAVYFASYSTGSKTKGNMFDTIKKLNGVNISYDSLNQIINIQNLNSDVPLENFKIPDELKKVCNQFGIGPGIKSIADLCDEDINIDLALDLEKISLKNTVNNKYEIRNGWLFNRKSNTFLGKIDKTKIYDFCFDRIGEFSQNIENFKELPKTENLNPQMKYQVKYPDGSVKNQTLDEQETYKEIEGIVQNLKDKVDQRTPSKDIPIEDVKKEFSKYEGEGINRVRTKRGIYSRHFQMNKSWRIAKAIYRWVAKNIKYDDDSTVSNCRKPQDPFFVFKSKTGVCAGKAQLTALMMRMAGIPSTVIGTLKEPNQISTHAYTAIYLEKNEGGSYDDQNNLVDNTKEAGWALIDATWGAPDSSKDPTNSGNNKSSNQPLAANANVALSSADAQKIKNFFSGFYQDKSLEKTNKDLLQNYKHHIFFTLTELSENPSSQLYGLFNNFGDSKIGIKFCLNNDTRSPQIFITGDRNGAKKDFKIPNSLLKYGYSIKIGGGIERISLSDEEVEKVDFDSECNIKQMILSTQNSKYITNDFGIYEKAAGGTKGKLIKVFNQNVITDSSGIKYQIHDKFISLEGNDGKDGGKKITHLDISKLPQDLKDFNRPFLIKNGFEKIDVPSGFNLDNLSFDSKYSDQTINIGDKFTFRGVDYDKSAKKPTIKELISLKPGLIYRLGSQGIILTSNDKNQKSLNIEKDIPQFLKDFKMKFSISSGIDSLICPEDQIGNLQFQNDSSVKNIDIISTKVAGALSSDLNSYVKDGVALYKNDEQVFIYNKGINSAESGVKYQITPDCIKLSGSEAKKDLDISKDIPNNLKKLNLPLMIGEGFNQVTLDDSAKILFESNCKLKKDQLKLAGGSKKYVIREDGLYVKNDNDDKNFDCQLLSFGCDYCALSNGIKYQIKDGNFKIWRDEENKKPLDIDQDIPLYLRDTKIAFMISKGFDSFKNPGSNAFYFLEDSHVKNFDLGKNSFYTKDDVAIYKYGELCCVYNRGVNQTTSGLKYQITPDCIKLSGSEAKKDLDISKDIPDSLKKLNLSFEIGTGFEKMTLNDSDNVKFSDDCGLNSTNLTLSDSSKKFVIAKDGIREKDAVGNPGKMMLKFKTDLK